MKKMLSVICVLALVGMLFSACGESANNMPEFILHDNVLGESMTLNMKKTSIESIWGEPTKEGDDYLYADEVLVTFVNGRAKEILVEWAADDGRWTVKSGITVGSKIDDVVSTYGEPTSKPDLDLGICYDYVYENTYAIRFVFDDESNVRFILLLSNI